MPKRKPLPHLQHLLVLGRIATPSEPSTQALDVRSLPDATLEQKYAPVPPSGSTYEQAFWDYVSVRNPQWTQQVAFNAGSQLITSADFYLPPWDLWTFIDGPVHLSWDKQAQDAIKRAAFTSQGHPVAVFDATLMTLAQFVRAIPAWYRMWIGD